MITDHDIPSHVEPSRDTECQLEKLVTLQQIYFSVPLASAGGLSAIRVCRRGWASSESMQPLPASGPLACPGRARAAGLVLRLVIMIADASARLIFHHFLSGLAWIHNLYLT